MRTVVCLLGLYLGARGEHTLSAWLLGLGLGFPCGALWGRNRRLS